MNALASLGARSLEVLRGFGHATFFFVDLLGATPAALRRFGLVVVQIHAIGNRSLAIITASGGGSSWGGWSSLCASFSTPSKHKKAPPNISTGVTAHGARALSTRAAGAKISLFFAEPLATAQITGSSRSGLTPETCWAFSARSSPSTPAVFLVATLVIVATLSRLPAMLSISARRLPPGIESRS